MWVYVLGVQPHGRTKSKFLPGVTDYSVIMTINSALILDSFADDFESHVRTCVFHILYVAIHVFFLSLLGGLLITSCFPATLQLFRATPHPPHPDTHACTRMHTHAHVQIRPLP
jgi:hypothetical protein